MGEDIYSELMRDSRGKGGIVAKDEAEKPDPITRGKDETELDHLKIDLSHKKHLFCITIGVIVVNYVFMGSILYAEFFSEQATSIFKVNKLAVFMPISFLVASTLLVILLLRGVWKTSMVSKEEGSVLHSAAKILTRSSD